MLYICIFSNKFDLNQTIRVSHSSTNYYLKALVHWLSLYVKLQQQQHVTFSSILALANRNDPICVVLPKVATIVTVTCHCYRHFCLKTITS